MSAAVEPLDYTDLEPQLHEAVHMAEVVCTLIEGAGRRLDGRQQVLEEGEWGQLLFAVYHTNKLVRALEDRWDEIHESNGTGRARA